MSSVFRDRVQTILVSQTFSIERRDQSWPGRVDFDSVGERQLRAKDRVDNEFGEGADRNAAPVFDEGRVFR